MNEGLRFTFYGDEAVTAWKAAAGAAGAYFPRFFEPKSLDRDALLMAIEAALAASLVESGDGWPVPRGVELRLECDRIELIWRTTGHLITLVVRNAYMAPETSILQQTGSFDGDYYYARDLLGGPDEERDYPERFFEFKMNHVAATYRTKGAFAAVLEARRATVAA